MPNFLLELGTEEMPTGFIEPALEQLKNAIARLLQSASIAFGQPRTAATSRKLAAFFADLAEHQPDSQLETVGPPASVAFDTDGRPTRAAQGFARSQGVPLEELSLKDTPKGKYLCVRRRQPGRPTLEILSQHLPPLIAGLRFPKSMRWRSGGISFARPLRSILALLGTEVIPFNCGGVPSDRFTHGHPFLAPGPIAIQQADWAIYIESLRKAFVVVEIAERKRLLREKIERVLHKHGSSLTHEDLLDQVTNLLEYPNIFVGQFDERFLELPAPAVEQAMIVHQSYFPVRDSDGRLLPLFIAALNRLDASAETVREGNERILRSRLADAAFFWEHDRRTPLAAKVPALKDVVSHACLGTYYDRTQRIVHLADLIARAAGLPDAIVQKARRAAHLCKADLVTHLVGEFPKLQGVLGCECALRDGEDPEVAAAIAEHYAPRSASDALPATDTGTIVALAEKFENLVGCFAADLAPTGSQDPYALRRAVYGILRIVLEKRISLSLSQTIRAARDILPQGLPKMETVETDVLGFLRERLNQWALERNYRYDQVNAALNCGFDDLLVFERRLQALQRLAEHPGWPDLVTVVQRTYNIFRNAQPQGQVRPELFETDDERSLWAAFQHHAGAIGRLIDAGQFEQASLAYLQAFSEPVHRFFDNVFVNVDDPAVRTNRLLLMKEIHELHARRIADLTQIVLGGP